MKYELRERAHELMREELVAAAFDVILTHGYASLTAEGLAQSLGISRATFFRYLGSKDEVIVAALLGPDDRFGGALRAARLGPDASWWQRLRVAFEPAAVLTDADPQRQRQRLRLVQSLPAVGARLRRARVPQTENLADALIDQGADVFEAHVWATAAVAVLDQCWVQWARDEGASLREILDRAFDRLELAGRPPASAD